MDYEEFLATGDPAFPEVTPEDEWEAIALNYTSGTTGNPKGVVYHHRGAYLNALGNVLVWGMRQHPVYLWTLPMFHCNGWCFPWTITAMAGTHVCLRRVEAAAIYEAIAREGVTHLCGAPVVMNMLLNAGPELQTLARSPHRDDDRRGAAARRGHRRYGGARVSHHPCLRPDRSAMAPRVVCAWHSEWDELPAAERARLKARQGVTYPVLEELTVADPVTLAPVAPDGAAMGEVLMRGNIVMKGYLKNPRATEEAFAGGWFHSGDLGVMHPDGYIELKDRSKDIIISGGENISTIEVEDVLYRHPGVLEAAVVARPDPMWGETPCAFVTLKPEATATAEEIIAFCREHLAHFKAPRTVLFGPLPKTSTGKIQKFVLRERAKAERLTVRRKSGLSLNGGRPMVTRAPFLKTRFGGYFHRESPRRMPNSPMSARARRAANISAASGSRSASPTSCATCRIGSRSWERSSWRSAIRAAPWVYSNCTARIGVRLWSSG